MTMTIEQTSVYMTVKEAPLLQGQQVCNFLETMNQEEVTKTAQEEQPLKTHLSELNKAYSWTVLMKDGVCAALGLGSIISTAKYSYDHSSYAKNVCDTTCTSSDWLLADRAPSVPLPLSNEQRFERCMQVKQQNEEKCVRWEEERIKDADYGTAKGFFISAIISGCAAVIFDLAVYQRKKNDLITHYTLSINDDRHLRLQNRIRQIGEKLKQPENEQEKSQLHIAQDYLRQKFDNMHVERNNKITLVQKYV